MCVNFFTAGGIIILSCSLLLPPHKDILTLTTGDKAKRENNTLPFGFVKRLVRYVVMCK